MNRFILQRFMRSLYLARYYFLVVLFVFLSLIITSIAKAIQTKEENPSQVLSSVLNSYKKLQSETMPAIILESVSETEIEAEIEANDTANVEESPASIEINLVSETLPESMEGHPQILVLGMLHNAIIADENGVMDSRSIDTSKADSSSIDSSDIDSSDISNTLSNTSDHINMPKEGILATEIVTEALHADISGIIEEHEEHGKPSTVELLIPDTIINNYLLFTLFPHRKTAIIEEPIARPYKEHAHVDDLSMMRMAKKIDASLSFSEDDLLEEWEGAEAYFDENHQYFDGDDAYQNEFQHADQGEDQDDHQGAHQETLADHSINSEQLETIEAPDSLAYPYLQDPLEIVEAESTFENFDEQPISQQIEQLITTGDYYLLANDPIKARQYYVRAVKTGATDKTSPFYAKALVKLADMEDNAYLARFQYTNALDIFEAQQGYDMEVADILVKLVWTFDMSSERIVIYELLTRAKQIHEKHSYTPQYSEVLRNLALYYETVDDFERADANYKAALALDLQYLTTSDIRTILALENYAAFYLKYGKFNKAEEILRFKLDAHEAISPPDYYNLGRTQSMLGWTYLQMNDLDDSLHHYNSALGNINYSITKNRFMPHYYSLPAIFDLIYFFIYTKEPELAVPYFDVAVSLLEAEDEGYVLRYLQETSFEDVDPEKVVNYPWAAPAEIKGLISIIEYIQSTQS